MQIPPEKLNPVLDQLKAAFTALSEFFATYKTRPQTSYTPPRATEAPQPAPTAPRAVLNPTAPYDWSTPKAACHSVRTICDEEVLAWHEKELIAKVINAESGFKNSAKCINRNYAGDVTSTDWGICQINDHYHIGKGKSFPSIQYVLDNPDKVVRWMIEQYKRGNLGWWVAYKNGSWKNYQSKI